MIAPLSNIISLLSNMDTFATLSVKMGITTGVGETGEVPEEWCLCDIEPASLPLPSLSKRAKKWVFQKMSSVKLFS